MYKKFSFLILVIFFIFTFSITGHAETTEINGYVPTPINLSRLAENPPQENSRHLLLKSSAGSKYDLREHGYVTSVKSQSPYGTCWAFAAIGAMESNYLINGGGDIDLSEMHLAWFTYANADKTKAFKSYTTSANLKTVLDLGGNSFYPAAVYGRLDGPVLESAVPYGEGKKPSATTPQSYSRVLRLRDVYYLAFGSNNVNKDAQSREIIKNRIQTTGAVVANYYNNDSSYKEVKTGEVAYYTKDTSVNHAVLIIGWDDSYSKDNFKAKPSSDGAWLIKNSWSNINPATSRYDQNYDGCFWMSYEQYLTDGSAFIVEDADSNMKVYYYDALGWCGSLYIPYGANIFKSERDGETLTEVAFFTPDNNVDYEINIYTGI
ncbi:MAG: hypothetical protein IJ597_05400 [Synergistaceae bacterium]|nr:hypothetical protein [Synergistaceae bacterium]